MNYENDESKINPYEAKGFKRQMVIMAPETLEHVKALGKQYKLTQGEIIDVTVNFSANNVKLLESLFRAKREEKIAIRSKEDDLVSKLKKISPEKRRQIEALLTDSK